MALREEIQKKIDKKNTEIEALEVQIRDARVYVQALEDTLKMLPRDVSDDKSVSVGTVALRAGSKADKARAAIRAAGRPLHVLDLLTALGIPNEPEERAALAGSLSSYARKEEIFTRPAPNTFGLIGMTYKPNQALSGPPPNFGKSQPKAEDDIDDFADVPPRDTDHDKGDFGLEEEELRAVTSVPAVVMRK